MTHEDMAQLIVAARNNIGELEHAMHDAIKRGEASATQEHIKVEMAILRGSIDRLSETWLHLRRVVSIGEVAATRVRNAPTDKA